VTSLAEVFVTVKPDMDRFGPEVKKKLTSIDTRKEGSRVAGRFGVGFNGAFGGIVKHSAGLFVGAFAAIKGVQFLTGFIEDARESAKVGRISAAVIKSTGGVAGITAGQLGDLATAISNKTGADDEAIQSGENLLATFTNVRNETGKGNDVFNRATQAAVDMAAAMNGGIVDANGLKAANIQLGKALNDPVKGVTALSKVGVSFTQQQKDQIKTLVDSGKTLDAQKIILGEVGKEFGGAAAAASDPLVRLKTIAGNLSEQFGGFLLPVVDRFATFVGDTVVPKVSAFADVFAAKVLPKLRDFGGFIQANVIPRLVQFAGFFRDQILPRLLEFAGFVTSRVIPTVATLAGNLVTTFAPAVKDVFGFFKTEVLPRLQDFASFVGAKVVPKVVELATALSKNKDFLVPFVAILAGGLIVFQAVSLAIKAWSAAQAILNVVLSANPIGLVVIGIAALVAGLIYAYKHSAKFREVLQGAFNGIRAAAQIFAPLVKAAIDIVIGVFSLWWNYYAKPILKGFGVALTTAWGLATKFGGVVAAGFNAIKEPARAAIAFVIGKFLGFVGDILTGASKAFGWVPNLGPKLKAAATEFGKFRDNVNNKLAGITDQEITVTAKLNAANINNKNANDPRLKNAFAVGGAVRGAGSGTSDSIPAMLSNGEHVWTAREVANAGGHQAMESMRSQFRGYAKGGAVNVGVYPRTPDPGPFANSLAASARAMVRPAAQAIANELGGLLGTMKWGRSQVGKPYIWGGVGPKGYDCSGFISALINVSRGRSPYHRLGATGSMPWSDMASGTGRFMVGWFNGNPGHTAATINGVNFESAGGVGVRVGGSARGAYDGLFTNRAKVKGFAKGGKVEGGDLPFDLLDPRGEAYQGKDLVAQLGIGSYADGAWRILADQLAMVHKDEMVVPAKPANNMRNWSRRLRSELHQRHVAHQAHVTHQSHETHENHLRLHPDDIQAIGIVVAGAMQNSPPQVQLDGRKVSLEMARSALGRGY
jgi:cell wall-associated NlpC family hydrolase